MILNNRQQQVVFSKLCFDKDVENLHAFVATYPSFKRPFEDWKTKYLREHNKINNAFLDECIDVNELYALSRGYLDAEDMQIGYNDYQAHVFRCGKLGMDYKTTDEQLCLDIYNSEVHND